MRCHTAPSCTEIAMLLHCSAHESSIQFKMRWCCDDLRQKAMDISASQHNVMLVWTGLYCAAPNCKILLCGTKIKLNSFVHRMQWAVLRGHNWVHFVHRLQCIVTSNSKFAILKTWNCFQLWIIWAYSFMKKSRRVFALFKSIFLRNRSWVTRDDFTVKNAKLGREICF